jgi:hypothetical protein
METLRTPYKPPRRRIPDGAAENFLDTLKLQRVRASRAGLKKQMSWKGNTNFGATSFLGWTFGASARVVTLAEGGSGHWGNSSPAGSNFEDTPFEEFEESNKIL